MAKPAPAPSRAPQNGPAAVPQDAFIVETYPDKATGEEKKKYHQVGTVFAHRTGEGQTLIITPGMSVSGEIVIFPRKPRDAGESSGH
jgi:hypothetical protein